MRKSNVTLTDQPDGREQIMRLRSRLPAIAPYPAQCIGFEARRIMNGTAFFPGGDGLWKSRLRKDGDHLRFPFGGILVLGSDFGDLDSYVRQFEQATEYQEEVTTNRTWKGLGKLFKLAEISPIQCFYTNAWPCLREGNQPVKGGIPGAR